MPCDCELSWLSRAQPCAQGWPVELGNFGILPQQFLADELPRFPMVWVMSQLSSTFPIDFFPQKTFRDSDRVEVLILENPWHIFEKCLIDVMDHGAGKIGDCQETGENSCEQVPSETDLGQCCLVWMCVCVCVFACASSPLCAVTDVRWYTYSIYALRYDTLCNIYIYSTLDIIHYIWYVYNCLYMCDVVTLSGCRGVPFRRTWRPLGFGGMRNFHAEERVHRFIYRAFLHHAIFSHPQTPCVSSTARPCHYVLFSSWHNPCFPRWFLDCCSFWPVARWAWTLGPGTKHIYEGWHITTRTQTTRAHHT